LILGWIAGAVFVLGVGEKGTEAPRALSPQKIIRVARARSGNRSLISSWKQWLRVPQLYQIGVVYMCTRLLTNITQMYIAMYMLDTLLAPENSIASIPFTVFASSLVFTALSNKIVALTNTAVATVVGCAMVIGACAGFPFLHPSHWQLIFPFAMLLGAGCGILQTTSLSLIADHVIGDNEVGTAFVYGSMSLTDKVANGLTILIIQLLAPTPTPGQTAYFYCKVMTYIPGGAAALAVLFLLPSIVDPPTLGDRLTERTPLNREGVEQYSINVDADSV